MTPFLYRENHYYLERGLPVIPFAQLILPEREDEPERDPDSHLKKLRRKSNDLKKELSDFRFWRAPQVYFEEDEDESRTKAKDTKGHSSMVSIEPSTGNKL